VRILHAIEHQQQRRCLDRVEQIIERALAEHTDTADLQARTLMALIARQAVQLPAIAPLGLDRLGLRQLHHLVHARVVPALLQDQQRGTLRVLLQQGAHCMQPENHRRFARHHRPRFWLRRRCHGPRTMR
jgi:hypothetical protein